jgi:UDP-N-acetylglucosamine diphosphorylase/glucosamine-1-phosphate N-acetyltransferase
MNIILFDDISWDNLLPLTFTRPVANLRLGILTLREKWEKLLPARYSFLTRDYLSEKYPVIIESDNYLINGALLPDQCVAGELQNLKVGEAITHSKRLLAARLPARAVRDFNPMEPELYTAKPCSSKPVLLDFPWQIFRLNGEEIIRDFETLTNGRKSATLSKTNNILNPGNVFVEEGVKAEFVTLNASTGPVYLAKNSEIMEGSVIRGPFALGEESTVKMGAKIYGPTTVGPFSKAGGEINNSVIMAYSNKGHDGFLGNSVLGEWCNIGADTNNSNLKNNYAEVRLWNYREEKFIPTGLQFCGLIMGDHSKCGINTMFNTGTVVGVSANIFGSGFPRNYVPSFTWGGAHGLTVFALPKVFDVATEVMQRRNVELTDVDKKILSRIFTITEKYRR